MIQDRSIFIKNIYYMIAYALLLPEQSGFEDIAKENFDNIHNLFAAILSNGLDRQLKQGLYREYVPKTESLATMRGKIDIAGTVRNRLQRKRLASCEYDELSENNLFNRIIKTTALLLIKCPDLDKKYAASLKRELMFFGGIDDMDPAKIPWQAVRCQRNNSTYRLLLGVCRLTLEGMLPTTDRGSHRLAAFVKEPHLSRLYEKFILEFYRRECPQLSASPSYIKWALDMGSDVRDLPQMKSDVTLTDRKTGNILIIDAKYYSRTMQEYYDSLTVRSGNLYQIFTYVKNKQEALKPASPTVSGMLLYAQTDDSAPLNNDYLMSGNKISVRTLNLNREFSEIAGQLKALARGHFGESCVE